MKPEDLHAVYSLLPYTAQVLIDVLGATHALALMDALPGLPVPIPKHADRHPDGSRRWAALAEIIGEDGMRALARRYGGETLYIPSCDKARRELRDRAIRAEFDRLTMVEGCSATQAVYEIGLKFRLNYRSIEQVCGRADAGVSPQAELF